MAELGFQGTPEGDPATYPEYDILYGQFCSVSNLIDSTGETVADFKPRQTKCPLLLSNPYHAYDYGAVFADDKNATVCAQCRALVTQRCCEQGSAAKSRGGR